VHVNYEWNLSSHNGFQMDGALVFVGSHNMLKDGKEKGRVS
jgi:hypothetical protein